MRRGEKGEGCGKAIRDGADVQISPGFYLSRFCTLSECRHPFGLWDRSYHVFKNAQRGLGIKGFSEQDIPEASIFKTPHVCLRSLRLTVRMTSKLAAPPVS